MRNKAIEYPHPVLNEYTNDFGECSFAVEIKSHGDNGKVLELELEHSLNCDGMLQMISDGIAKMYVRIICYRTSFRTVEELNPKGSTIISIPKKLVADVIDLQAMIVAVKDYDNYNLGEFNKDYFEGMAFKISKGSVIANEPGLKIKLNTVLEKNVSGIVQVTGSPSISEMVVKYASVEETDPAFSNYIVITLPDNEYKNYAKLRTKKHLKNGVERFLQCSIILPAVTEAISILRREELVEVEEDEPHYKGTVWADSIMQALSNLGIEELSTCTRSDYELANLILGNVVGDSVSNLMQKLTDWSTIRQEDESL